jgi:hypothetical protein
MPESIYYQNRHLLADVLQGSLLAPGVLSSDRGWASQASLEQQEGVLAPEGSDSEPLRIENPSVEVPGAFFTNPEMLHSRKLAVADIAGIVVVRQSVGWQDLKEMTGLKSFTFEYALGFLTAQAYARHTAAKPTPVHRLVEQYRESSQGVRLYRPTEILSEMAEVAEDEFPLLHQAMQTHRNSESR